MGYQFCCLEFLELDLIGFVEPELPILRFIFLGIGIVNFGVGKFWDSVLAILVDSVCWF